MLLAQAYDALTSSTAAEALDLSSELTAFPCFEILSSMSYKRGLMRKSKTFTTSEKEASLHPTVLCWYMDLGNQSAIFLILHETIWMELTAFIF